MKRNYLLTVAYAGVATAAGSLLSLPLDLVGLLKYLRPASANDPRFSAFVPPDSDDVRSPCPALNALANHGFISHDGRGLTIPQLVKGLSEGLNIGAEVTVALAGAALHTSSNPTSGAFDLSDLIAIEHDASMSRQDATFGNAQPFNDDAWKQYLAIIDQNATVDIPTAARAKFARYNDSLTHNPEFKYDARALVLSYGENALYLQAMSDPMSGKARLDYVQMFFEQEKLPFELGWRPSSTPITLASVGAMIVRLIASSPEPLPETGTIVIDTYKGALVTLAGGSQILAKLTGGLSSLLGL